MTSAIDLFSGAGGFSLGLKQAGIDIWTGVDNWAPAVQSYRANFDHEILHTDVQHLRGRDLRKKFGEIDLVVGGPPCQGFSIQRIGPDYDPRQELVLEFARVVSEVKATGFIMENVPGLSGRRGQHVLAAFNKRMRLAGYTLTQAIVNAADYGVPQLRRRLIVFGQRGATVGPIPASSVSSRMTVREALEGLPEPSPPGSKGPDPLHVQSKLSPLNQKRIALIPPGGGFEDLPRHLRVRAHRSGATRIGHRNVYGRLHPDRPAVTITGHFDSFTRGKFGHPWAPRNLTLREGARLQSLPDNFQVFGTREEVAAQIGNAVPPTLALKLAHAMERSLAGRAIERLGSHAERYVAA